MPIGLCHSALFFTLVSSVTLLMPCNSQSQRRRSPRKVVSLGPQNFTFPLRIHYPGTWQSWEFQVQSVQFMWDMGMWEESSTQGHKINTAMSSLYLMRIPYDAIWVYPLSLFVIISPTCDTNKTQTRHKIHNLCIIITVWHLGKCKVRKWKDVIFLLYFEANLNALRNIEVDRWHVIWSSYIQVWQIRTPQ